jgi:tetratricopeptide (TPR) repeat protein
VPDDARLSELLLDWQEQYDRGRDVPAAELCRQCPELAADLDRQIAVLRHVGGLVLEVAAGTPGPGENDTPASGADAGQRTWPYLRGRSTTDLPDIPGFDIRDKLGEGGMGVVYLARQVPLNRLVALKMILAGTLARREEKARFLSEAEAVAALQHPGIVQIHEFGTHDGLPYFSLEYCSGGSLAKKLAGTPLPPAEAAVTVERLARAMQAAHDAGVVHRDLKPGNVLLTADGTPKITDFGLAKRVEGDSGLTQSGAILGTPSYMAPEQATESRTVGPPADIYALGAILYECLTGRPPHKAATPLDTVLHVIEHEPAAVRRLNPKVPADLETICHKCLQKDPARRYPTAAALADDLGRWQRGEPITARPVGHTERAWRWCRRNPALAGSLAAVVVVVALGVVGLSVGLVKVDRLRRTAEGERDRAVAARAGTRDVLDMAVSGLTGDAAAAQKELSPELKKLFDAVLPYYEQFAAEPGEDREGLDRLAKAHDRLARIHLRLGNLDRAAAVHRKAGELYTRLVAENPQAPTLRARLAASFGDLALAYYKANRLPEAAAAWTRSLEAQEALAAQFPDDPSYRIDVGRTLSNLGVLYANQKDWPAAEDAFRRALAVKEKLANEAPKAVIYREDLAAARDNFGGLLKERGKPAEAEPYLRQAIADNRALNATIPRNPRLQQKLARSLANLADLLAATNRPADAETAFRQAIAIEESLASAFPGQVDYAVELANSYAGFGDLVLARGDTAGAVQWFSKAIDRLTPVVRAAPREVGARQLLVSNYRSRAAASVRLRQFAAALPDFDRALEFGGGSSANELRLGRADCLARFGRAAEAAAEVEKIASAKNVDAGTLYDCACALSVASAADDSAEAYAGRAVEFLRQAVGKGPVDVGHLLADDDLAPLRRRGDYAAFLWDLADSK